MSNRETFLPKIVEESKFEIDEMNPEARAMKLARRAFTGQTKSNKKEKMAAAEEFINLLYQLKKTAAENKIYKATVIDTEIKRALKVLAGPDAESEQSGNN
jgi:hypothetical protein